MSGYLLDMRPRGAGGGSSPVAPVDATYITQTPNATLTNEQALSLLATGLLKNTTGTGVLSIGVPTIDFASAAQGALADTSLQPGDIGVTVQSWDADLDTLAALAKIKGNLIAGTGATWQALPVGADGLALVADSLEATGLKWAAIVAGVSSVFGRTGAVIAALNDYPASFITNTPAGGIASVDVQGALNELDTEKAAITSLATVAFTGAYGDLSGLPTLGTMAAFNDAPSDGSTYGRNNGAWTSVVAGVSSVFARTGAVVSANGDYTASQITNVPAGNIAGVTVQAAIDELDTEKAGLALSNLFTVRQDIRAAGSSFAAGAYIPWITGDTLSTLYVGSTSTSATVKAIEAYAANQVAYLESKHTSNSYNTLQLLTNSTNGTCISATSRATAAPGTAMYLESAGALTMYMEQKGTASLNAKLEMFRIIRAPTSGTPAAGFGYYISFKGSSSTSYGQDMGRLSYEWATATHASRKARSVWSVYDTAEREGIRIEASGTAPMLGFYGTAAVAQQTVTGSRGGNAALADLLTKLATLGLIIDGSSA